MLVCIFVAFGTEGEGIGFQGLIDFSQKSFGGNKITVKKPVELGDLSECVGRCTNDFRIRALYLGQTPPPLISASTNTTYWMTESNTTLTPLPVVEGHLAHELELENTISVEKGNMLKHDFDICKIFVSEKEVQVTTNPLQRPDR
jgi:hypothetical protein